MVDADEVGPAVFGDEIEAEIAAVRLCVDGEIGGLLHQEIDGRLLDHPVAEIRQDDQVVVADPLRQTPVEIGLPRR